MNNEFTLEKVELNPHIKFIIKLVAGVIVSLFLIMSGCAMHSNTYDGERLQGDADVQRAITEARVAEVEAQSRISIAESAAKKEETLAIERLIGKGVNPIAARCAVKGWSDSSRDTTCLVATATPVSLSTTD